MCVSTFIYGMGTLACALTSLSFHPPAQPPIAHRNVRSSKKKWRIFVVQQVIRFLLRIFLLASVVNAGDVSETLFVSFGSCELPSPRETTLYREIWRKSEDKAEATHRDGKNPLSVAESNRIEDFKPRTRWERVRLDNRFQVQMPLSKICSRGNGNLVIGYDIRLIESPLEFCSPTNFLVNEFRVFKADWLAGVGAGGETREDNRKMKNYSKPTEHGIKTAPTQLLVECFNRIFREIKNLPYSFQLFLCRCGAGAIEIFQMPAPDEEKCSTICLKTRGKKRSIKHNTES